jgi:thiamine phosphate synthase YjbQ (UPF0047 family)
MHSIKPNTKYAIVKVEFAVETNDKQELSNITDGLNEMIRPACAEGFIGDWRFDFTDNIKEVVSSSDPEEGEIFQNS